MNLPRPILHVILGGIVLTLAACAQRWQRPLTDDGRYCYLLGKARHPTCTEEFVPSVAADQEAKRFVPDPQGLVLYAVRHRWADARNIVWVTVDDGAPVATVPASFLRWRLAPGRHRLGLSWDGGQAWLDIEGQAGQVQFVSVAGAVWPWGASYRWAPEEGEDGRRLVEQSRLIAAGTAP